jgi:predicted amidohydrolase YtcJ
MAYAHLVFRGGPVFVGGGPTADGEPTGVAVRDGRIVAVGDDVDDLVGPGTEVVDLADRLLVPGFQDAHVHPVEAGLVSLRCDLADLPGAAAYLDTIGAYARTHPGAEWISGGGWSMAAFPAGTPRREDLDTVVPDRPALLHNRDGHGAWANGEALRRAGITAHTPDPPDGRIERDPDGTPSGTLHEGAVALVGAHVPPATADDAVEALRLAQRRLHALGVTAWQDAIIGTYGSLRDPGDAYLALIASGELTARVVGALWWDRDRGLDQVDELRERRERLTGGRFRATTVKIMQDGVAENFTAGLLEPYAGGCDHGLSFVDPQLLCEAVTRLDADGFQVHFHAIGDRAVREVLDAVAAARAANGPNDNRHHAAHLQVVHPDDVPRFAALGVAATAQPLWATYEPQMTELTIPFLGPERTRHQYPFGDLVRAGAVLAGGSDWPVSSADPLRGIHVAVNRMLPADDPDHDPRVFLPEQRLDLATALSAYTAGSAYVNHLDDAGTIAAGNAADLVVLDRNPFAAPADEIAETRVLRTYVAGDRAYAAD